MKTDKNILIAFILNLGFSIFEILGGFLTGSVAIMSDAVHDVGDAASIGVSYFLEKKSKKQPDKKYSYGYGRYSVMGGLLSMIVLVCGSLVVIFNAIGRIVNPVLINYDGMIMFAIVGVLVNFIAAFYTRDGDSLNQKAVNLHMIEDVLGWIVVLVGGVVIKFTGWMIIDPVMSIGVAVFILVNALKSLQEIMDIFLEKTPCSVDVEEIKEHLKRIDGVIDVHHIHIWTLDGVNNYATMHVVADSGGREIKQKIKEELFEHGIGHVTLELEKEGEGCLEKNCRAELGKNVGHCHHHHH